MFTYQMKANTRRAVPIVIKDSRDLSICKLTFDPFIRCKGHFYVAIVAKISQRKVLWRNIKSFTPMTSHTSVASGEWFCRFFIILKCFLLTISILLFFTHSQKKFKNQARLKTHEDIHNKTQYICNVCGISLNTKRTLKMHMVINWIYYGLILEFNKGKFFPSSVLHKGCP